MNENTLALDLNKIETEFSNPIEFFKTKKLCLFKSCLEKYFPGVRWGIQDLLEELNLDVNVCFNQTCCSGTFFQRNLITRAQFAAINHRNLIELNRVADIILFSCNGCYNSIMRSRDFLENQEVKRKAQLILDNLKEKYGEKESKEDYEILHKFNGRLVHDLDFLYLIKSEVVNSLKFDLQNLKVAVHYGCHYLNLSRDKKNTLSYIKDKTKLEEFITLFGGKPVDYQERESCCGWGASQFIIHPKEALKITYNKLQSAQNVDADFILVCCPTCLYTLSKPEFRKKINEWFGNKVSIPIIHINELIAILRGCEEERCITSVRKSPRLEEIFNIITKE